MSPRAAEQSARKRAGARAASDAEWLRWFEDLSLHDADRVGGKAANLGEMAGRGIPVPPGFCVTAAGFLRFLEEAGLHAEILERLARLDVDDGAALRATAEELRRRVREAPLPRGLREAIVSAYRTLGERGAGESGGARDRAPEEPFVAVRSSATAEDMPGTSFAGMNETYLNVRGETELLTAVRDCWASLYGARVLFYRRKQGIPEEMMAIAVVVQQMVESDAAGVMFTVNPATHDRNTLVIEGAFGLGEVVVSGRVSPDHWEVCKDTLEITGRQIGRKRLRIRRGETGGNRTEELPSELAEQASVGAEQIRRLAELGRRIEAHYGKPQDIEWALADGQIFIVQSRPVTALPDGAELPAEGGRAGTRPAEGEILVRGLGASPGMASGAARVLASLEQQDLLQPGEVLVARMTEPDWTPIMKRAAAIVTDEGGMTAHAAIVSRELGIPCIVGTRDGSRQIPDGAMVTVDAARGVVCRGRTPEKRPSAVPARPADLPAPTTATRLYVNLAQAELAEAVSRREVDGVGLLRVEFMILGLTENTHPRKLLQEGRGDLFRDRLAENLSLFARAFAPRPVVVRTTDFRTNEYRNMAGGTEFEAEEANPMIGYRGAYRYLQEADLFRLELEAFLRVRETEGLRNLVLMLPFVRTLSELRRCVSLVEQAGLTEDPAFRLWIMAEVPSVIYRLPEYVRAGVQGVSIGSNDLTQLMLGVDRDNRTLAPLFDERDPAVLGAIRDIIRSCRDLGVTCSICGQAPSVYPELTEQLVEWGIDSISVNPDAIDRTRRIIAAAEQRVLLRAARSGPGSPHAKP